VLLNPVAKFAESVVDTGGNLPPLSLTTAANLPHVSLTPVAICYRYQQHQLYQWQNFPSVSLIPLATLPLVSLMPVANLPPVVHLHL
jgi:hypothetical protein